MFETMMVPVDGSRLAERALPVALTLAERAGAGIRLVYVHSTLSPAMTEGGPEMMGEVEAALREQAREYVEEVGARLRDEGATVSTSFLRGPVARTLADEAEEHADLVVMTSHGRGVFSRFWLGSVADGVIRHARVPVLVLRTGEDGDGGTADAEPPPARPEASAGFRRVLVPLDGSRLAEAILEPARELGGLTGAAFLLLRVLPPIMEPGYGYEDLPEGLEVQQVEELRTTAETYLDEVASRLDGSGGSVEAHTVVDPHPARAILRFAEERDVDLIALATHGRGGIRRLLLGSVADKLVRASHLPILVFQPREE